MAEKKGPGPSSGSRSGGTGGTRSGAGNGSSSNNSSGSSNNRRSGSSNSSSSSSRRSSSGGRPRPASGSKSSSRSKGGKGSTGTGESQFLRLLVIMTLALLVIYLTVSCNKVVEPAKDQGAATEQNGTITDEATTDQNETAGQEDTQDTEKDPATVTDDQGTTGDEPNTDTEVPAVTEETATESAVDTTDTTNGNDRPPINDFSELDHELDNTVFDDSLNPADLSNEKLSWWFTRNTTHSPVVGGTPKDFNMQDYGAYFRVNTDEKVVYLTFDAGYEHPNRYTAQILDTLAANGVQGTFFVTQTYVRDNPDLAKRMKEEGHLVGNHTVHHKSSPDLTDEAFNKELTDTADYFKETTGYDMDPFFRPPMGEYSERTLFLARKLGYRTIFWSLTYKDYDTENQPGKDYAYQHVIDNIHPGAIPLLHAVSSSNTEALDDIIKTLRDEGYRFGSLYELE